MREPGLTTIRGHGHHKLIWFSPKRQNKTKAQLYGNTALCLPEYLQALSSLLSHLQTLRWGQHLPTLLSPTEPRPERYIHPNDQYKAHIYVTN